MNRLSVAELKQVCPAQSQLLVSAALLLGPLFKNNKLNKGHQRSSFHERTFIILSRLEV